MAVIMDEGHVDNPESLQPKNAVDEIYFTDNIDTINPTPKTDNMEVHHHTHAGHGKKSWKSYFWEFFMLFLAVFCGFLAEYQLERTVEHHRETEYMESLLKDLKQDTAALSRGYNANKKSVLLGDKLCDLLSKRDFGNTSGQVYLLCISFGMRAGFNHSDGTIQQLKNAGGLRLIRKRVVVDSLQLYMNMVKGEQDGQVLDENLTNHYLNQLNFVLDATVVNGFVGTGTELKPFNLVGNPPLISEEKQYINNINMALLSARISRKVQMRKIVRLKILATNLIELVKKEYNLE